MAIATVSRADELINDLTAQRDVDADLCREADARGDWKLANVHRIRRDTTDVALELVSSRLPRILEEAVVAFDSQPRPAGHMRARLVSARGRLALVAVPSEGRADAVDAAGYGSPTRSRTFLSPT